MEGKRKEKKSKHEYGNIHICSIYIPNPQGKKLNMNTIIPISALYH